MSDGERSYDEDEPRSSRGRRSDECGGGARRGGEAKKKTEAQPRTRMMMSPAQLEGLQALWNTPYGNDNITKFPTTSQREALAQRIGLTPRKTQVWFQNQRQKLRRVELQQGLNITSPSTSQPSFSYHPQPLHPLAVSSYSSQDGDAAGFPSSSSTQTSRRLSYAPYSVQPPPPHPYAGPPPDPYYPSYSPYPPQPHPPPDLPHHTSYFPRNRNDPVVYPVAVRPPEEDYYIRAGTYLSPPTIIQLKINPEEERRQSDRRELERRRAEEAQRDQDMRDEGWVARRAWEAREKNESIVRGAEGVESPTGWFEVAAARSSRRVSEGQAIGSWPGSQALDVPRHASYPGSFGTASQLRINPANPRQTTFPIFSETPFGPAPRAPPSSHERFYSSQRPHSPMQVESPGRSVSPTVSSPYTLPLPPRNFATLEEKSVSPVASSNPSPLSSTVALPSFRDFLSTTSTTTDLLPSSIPPSPTHASALRSSYASSSSSSYPERSRKQSSVSTRGIGGASDGASRGGNRMHTSQSTSSHPRSPTTSTYEGGNRGLPLPRPSLYTTSSSSSSIPGLLRSSTNESSSRSTLASPSIFPPPPPSAFGPESYPPYRKGTSSIDSSSISSSAYSASSLPRPTTSSLLTSFNPSIGPASFAPLPRSREGSQSNLSSSEDSTTEKQASSSASAEAAGWGVESMDMEEDGAMKLEGGELAGGGATSSSSRELPGLLDVSAGFEDLGRFAVSSAR